MLSAASEMCNISLKYLIQLRRGEPYKCQYEPCFLPSSPQSKNIFGASTIIKPNVNGS